MSNFVEVKSFGNIYKVAEKADDIVKSIVKDAEYMIKDRTFTVCLCPVKKIDPEDRAFIYYVGDKPYRVMFTNKYSELEERRKRENGNDI